MSSKLADDCHVDSVEQGVLTNEVIVCMMVSVETMVIATTDIVKAEPPLEKTATAGPSVTSAAGKVEI